jgi:hypothetical protein
VKKENFSELHTQFGNCYRWARKKKYNSAVILRPLSTMVNPLVDEKLMEKIGLIPLPILSPLAEEERR